MRSTKLFQVSMESVMAAGTRLVFVGVVGHLLGETGTALMLGGAWAGLKGSGILGPREVEIIPRKGESKAGRLRRIASSCNTTEELEKAIIREWKLPQLAWRELVVLPEETRPEWARLLRGEWVARGIADRWKLPPVDVTDEGEINLNETDIWEISWAILDWLDQEQMDEIIDWLRTRQWNSILEGILKNMSHEAWSKLRRETLKSLMMSTHKEIRLAAMAGARKNGVKAVAGGSVIV